MQMTFQQYIDNPLGKRNAVFSQRNLYKDLYTDKFDKILLREAGNIDYILYVDKEHDRYIAHIKIPSETVKNFYYDAVIMFYTDNALFHSSDNLNGYFVKFFSNDPAFVFTYLRVFLKNNLFFEDLKSKSSNLALKRDPKEKNPYEIPGYSKILYFAYLFMKSRMLFKKHRWTTYGVPYNKQSLLSRIEHTDKKISERQKLGEQVEKEKREENKKNKESPKSSDIRRAQVQSKSNNSRMKITPFAKTAKVSKKSPTAKKAKGK